MVELPETLEDFVRQKIAAGEFLTPNEVVCAGLKLLQQREAWKADTRNEIDRGWEQATAGELRSGQDVRESLAERKEAWRQSRPK